MLLSSVRRCCSSSDGMGRPTVHLLSPRRRDICFQVQYDGIHIYTQHCIANSDARSQIQGRANDRWSYLRETGEEGQQVDNCDIFFPTNFAWLTALFDSKSGSEIQTASHVMKSSAFASKFSDVKATQCIDGEPPHLTSPHGPAIIQL